MFVKYVTNFFTWYYSSVHTYKQIHIFVEIDTLKLSFLPRKCYNMSGYHTNNRRDIF